MQEEYTDQFKSELDNRLKEYQMQKDSATTEAEMNAEIVRLLDTYIEKGS